MKKATKLLLSILPISSISLLSLVSCSTTSSNNKKPEENRTDKTPEKEPEKLPENSKKPDNESKINPKEPDSNKPNYGDKNNKEPEGNNSNNQPTDQPQADEPNHHNVDFSDLEKIEKEINFDSFKFYKDKDPKTAWFELVKNPNETFKKIIFNKNINILNKYKINFESDFSNVVFILEKGIIENVQIKFTKDNQSKIFIFTFSGFKKANKTPSNKIDGKQNYVKKKESLDKKIVGLHPSLLAYMLLYAEDNKIYEKIQRHKDVINFEELKNKNTNLFSNDFVGFNILTKEWLFEYNEADRTKYKDKIVAASYDDINGELQLELEISNREEIVSSDSKNTVIKQKFEFKGFRKISFDKPNDNVLFLSLLQSDLKEIITKGSLKSIIDPLIMHKKFNEKIQLPDGNIKLKNEIFKKLIVDIQDNQNHIYKSAQTLKIDSNNSQNEYKSIIGLADNSSLYPFHTKINKDSIKNFYITINNKESKKEVEIEFDVYVPIYASTLSELLSHSTIKDEKLKIKVISSTKFD
ncbi:LppA family lipoprotein [Mycoplasma capricolum subsp. capricolum]|uniref:LppA family lipoprotein n=1 Tax=Mycoplasma capricolum TaxID=2095 RepID=UPI003DA3D800